MLAYRPHAARTRMLGCLTALTAAAALTAAPAAQAETTSQIDCYTYTYNGQGSVDCTDSLQASINFTSWSETGATSVYESTPYELGYYCRIGTAVTAVLHTTGGSAAWSGTCA